MKPTRRSLRDSLDILLKSHDKAKKDAEELGFGRDWFEDRKRLVEIQIDTIVHNHCDWNKTMGVWAKEQIL